MEQHRTKLYVSGAFVAGVLLCLGFKDFYPDLEWRFRRRPPPTWNKTMAGAGLIDDDELIGLKDDEGRTATDRIEDAIPDGIEACIGNTPLFRIKSLSQATGCEILGKAEVPPIVLWWRKLHPDGQPVSQRGRWEPQRSSGSQYDRYGNDKGVTRSYAVNCLSTVGRGKGPSDPSLWRYNLRRYGRLHRYLPCHDL